MILFFPWSRMKHSSESRSLWRNGFSSFTTVTCIDPDASDTWWQTTQVQKIGPRFFPSLGSETTTSSFASQSNKILYDTHTWDEHYIAIPQITWRNSQQWHWNHKFSPNTVICLSNFDIMRKTDEHLRSAVSNSHSLSTSLSINLSICSLLTVLTKVWLTFNNKANCYLTGSETPSIPRYLVVFCPFSLFQ